MGYTHPMRERAMKCVKLWRRIPFSHIAFLQKIGVESHDLNFKDTVNIP